MLISQVVINDTFCKLIPYSNGNILTNEGFKLLADWCEKQEWWHEFARHNGLGHFWRNSYKSDPYWFAITLFKFITRFRA